MRIIATFTFISRLNGMVECGDRHKHIYQRAMLLVEQVKVSKGSPLVTSLLEGPSGRYTRTHKDMCIFTKLLVNSILTLPSWTVVKLH